jgi:hypothetical protein
MVRIWLHPLIVLLLGTLYGRELTTMYSTILTNPVHGACMPGEDYYYYSYYYSSQPQKDMVDKETFE